MMPITDPRIVALLRILESWAACRSQWQAAQHIRALYAQIDGREFSYERRCHHCGLTWEEGPWPDRCLKEAKP